jgi:hypothetical protein
MCAVEYERSVSGSPLTQPVQQCKEPLLQIFFQLKLTPTTNCGG